MTRLWKAIWHFEWGMASIGAGLCLLMMMMITVLSVFGRYVLHTDLIPGAYNIVERILFPLMVFWALPLAHREKLFPRLESFPATLSSRWQTIVSAFVLVVEIAIYAVVLWYVTRFVWASIQSNRTMQIGIQVWPLWPVIVMMPLAFALMVLEMARLLVEDFLRLLGRLPAD
ncbi:MAG: TRAP transporter small permease [Bauldia sp.]|nr:MAG: TRAP transporter small permease [Bauldia sp.]